MPMRFHLAHSCGPPCDVNARHREAGFTVSPAHHAAIPLADVVLADGVAAARRRASRRKPAQAPQSGRAEPNALIASGARLPLELIGRRQHPLARERLHWQYKGGRDHTCAAEHSWCRSPQKKERKKEVELSMMRTSLYKLSTTRRKCGLLNHTCIFVESTTFALPVY